MSDYIFFFTLFIGIIPLLILFIKKRAFDKNHPIVPFIWLTALASAYEFIFTIILKINTSYWFQLYALLSFLALFYFFFKLLKLQFKTVLKWSLIVFLIIYANSFIYWTEMSQYISTAINRAYITVFVLFFTVIWFKTLFEKLQYSTVFEKIDVQNLWQSEIFYFISGIFIYYSTTLFLFLSINYIFNNNSIYFYDYWFVNTLATLLFRTLMIVSVWKMKTV